MWAGRGSDLLIGASALTFAHSRSPVLREPQRKMSFDAPGQPSPFREKEKEKREKEEACSVNSKEESMKCCPWSLLHSGLVLVECNYRSCATQCVIYSGDY